MIAFCTGKDKGAKVSEALTKALAQDPQNVRLHLQMAALYMEQKSLKEAEATYKQAVELAPKDPLPWLALGDFYVVATQQFDDAVSAYKQAVTLKPEAGLPKLIELTLRQHKLDDAARYVQELLKSKESKTVGKYWKGRLVLAKGQSVDAIAILQDVVREQPTCALVHYYLGLALMAHNNLPLAKTSFEEATRLAPNLVEAHQLKLP